MLETLWFHAQLLFIDGSLLHGVSPPLDILSRILSREPPQHFSCVSAVFYKDGPLRLTSIFSRKSLFYYSLFPLRHYHRLIPIAEIWACFTPLPTLKTWTLCFICLLLPVTEALRRHSNHTIALFIFHNYNFSSSDPVKLSFSNWLRPYMAFAHNPGQILLKTSSSPSGTCPRATYTRPSSTLTSPSIMIQQLPHY